MENQLKMIVIAALALSAAFAAPARVHAEPGRCDALRLLIEQLPDANPHEDPGYLDGVSGYLLPQQLTSCHWKPEEMAAIERILALFDKDRTADGCDSQALIATWAACRTSRTASGAPRPNRSSTAWSWASAWRRT